MKRLLRMFGHCCGVTGTVLGFGTIARFLPAGIARIFPALLGFSHFRATGSLSLWLIGLGMLLVQFGRGE